MVLDEDRGYTDCIVYVSSNLVDDSEPLKCLELDLRTLLTVSMLLKSVVSHSEFRSLPLCEV